MSYALSVCYLTFFAGTFLALAWLVHKNFKESFALVDMKERYPDFAALFELMRPTKSAQ